MNQMAQKVELELSDVARRVGQSVAHAAMALSVVFSMCAFAQDTLEEVFVTAQRRSELS